MKVYLFLATVALSLLACSSVSSTNSSKANYSKAGPVKKERERDENLYIPIDMPDICQNIDFNANKDMQKDCGVKPISQSAYNNSPKQRYLVAPGQASLVKTGDKIEILFPNTDPLALKASLLRGVEFDESKRLSKIQNTMDYKEFFNERRERLKLFKLKINSDTKPIVENEICFKVPEIKGDTRITSASTAPMKMELLTCEAFNKFVKKYAK
ncbi:MAG: hypothetical protein LBC64_03380 [Fibromonadaceae bacterium]|jgi:hypothetical protein|nr:hypothetical protein [Fibromonadaceae bacterium]